MDVFSQVTDKFDARNCRVMQVVYRLAMLIFNVAQDVVLCLDKRIARVLTRYELTLLRKSLNFVDGYETIHVSSNYIDVLINSNALEIDASHGMTFYFLVSKVSDLLLCMVK